MTLPVPALKADEYFTGPFWVNVKFDPPRQYRLDHVHFDVDRAGLRPDLYTRLEELLTYLQRHEDIRIEIAGHTGNTGTPGHNLKLSQDRANWILKYMVSKGIKPARLRARGYGAEKPVAENSTEKGKQLNRRTEVLFYKNIGIWKREVLNNSGGLWIHEPLADSALGQKEEAASLLRQPLNNVY